MFGDTERREEEAMKKAEEQAEAAERATETDDTTIDANELLEAEEEPESRAT